MLANQVRILNKLGNEDDVWTTASRHTQRAFQSADSAVHRAQPAPPQDRQPTQGSIVMETVVVQCPYCLQWQELGLDPGTEGRFVQDCEVCCHPWEVTVEWEGGEALVHVERAQ